MKEPTMQAHGVGKATNWWRIAERHGEAVLYEGPWAECVRVWGELGLTPETHELDVRVEDVRGKGVVARWWMETALYPRTKAEA